jgi:hypothetical protein
MPRSDGQVFPQRVIAVIWDFDKTLIPGYMQTPLFKRYGIDEGQFWAEVNALPAFYEAHGHPLFPNDIGYLSHILTYVREGLFHDLSNRTLRELGADLDFYPGLPAFFADLKTKIEGNPALAKYEIKLEHYVVSTGLRQMVYGSAIAAHVEDVWACELLGVTAPPGVDKNLHDANPESAADAPLNSIAYAIDNTTKTRAIFEINKGVNKHPEINVNARMPHEARRVPFDHMIYVADGPSDVPVFSIVKQYGGKTFAVYPPEARETEFRQAMELQEQERVMGFGPADYRAGTHTHRCITTWAEEIAESIANRFEVRLGESIGKPPEHIVPKTPQSESR